MIKQIQKLKLGVVKLLEEELMVILALLATAMLILSTSAQTSDQTNLSFTICPANVGITVVAPNGGERWLVNSSQDITWTTCDPAGAITNVKIELQRDTGGAWETLVASTPNDGTYTWPTVTEPTTTTALIRVSNASDPTANDTSNSVFEIYKGGGGPHPCANVVIDKVVPWTFVNTEDVTLVITGYFAYGDEQVYLDEELLDSTYISQERIDALVPAGFPPGRYVLRVTNYCGNYAEYGIKIVVTEEECQDPIIDEVSPTTFSNAEDVTLTIKGQFAYGDEAVFLDEEPLDYSAISETEIEAYVPAGFPPGTYTLLVVNGCGGRAEYGTKIVIYEEEEEEETIIDKILEPILDLFKPFIKPPSTGGVIRPKPFVPESKFFTDAFERNWICYLTWLIILLLFMLILREYLSEDDPKKKKKQSNPSPPAGGPLRD